MTCGEQRRRCAAILGYRNPPYRNVSTIKQPRVRTASHCRQLPTRFTISLSSAVSNESPKSLTPGLSNCDASLGMFLLRTWSGCLRLDLTHDPLKSSGTSPTFTTHHG